MNITAFAADERPITAAHNQPPEPTPFDLSKTEIDDLAEEARNWLDGAGVNSEADADGVSKLIDKLRKAISTADERRKTEKKPHDDAISEIQGRYNALIGETKAVTGTAILAIDVAKKALAPWLAKVEAAQRAAAEAARIAAEEAQAAAIEAMRASRASADLAAREAAEALAQQAKAADRIATKAENVKAHAKGGTRAIGLRTVWTHKVTDSKALAAYVWTNHRADLDVFLDAFAKRLVDGGNHSIPGVTVTMERVL